MGNELWPAVATVMRSAWFRWGSLAALVIVAVGLHGLAGWALEDDQTRLVFAFYFTWIPAFLAVVSWFWLLSNVALLWRVRVTSGLCVLAIAFLATVRVDGFTGDMWPRFAWRWSPSGADRARAFRLAAKSGRDEAPTKRTTLRPVTDGGASPATRGHAESSATDDLATPSDAEPWHESAADWPAFRGASRDGIVRPAQLGRVELEELARVNGRFHEVWRHPVGPAWSSFAVAGEQVVTQEQRDQDEAVVCYDFATGRELWENRHPGEYARPPAGTGPRATPTIVGDRVYVVGGLGRLVCLDRRSGRTIWSRDPVRSATGQALEWGTSASPLVAGDLVIVHVGEGERSLWAYDRHTGTLRWSAGTHAASYASPQLFDIAGVRVLVQFDAHGGAGFDVETGLELWRHPLSNGPGINGSQPMPLGDDRLLLSTSYGTGSCLLELTPGRDRTTAWRVREVWSSRQFKLKYNTGFVVDGFAYGLDEGVLCCLDMSTGKRQWRQQRFGFGQMLRLGDRLLIVSETGDIVLVAIDSRGYRELSRQHVLDDPVWALPALARGHLFVRSATEAVALRVMFDEPVK